MSRMSRSLAVLSAFALSVSACTSVETSRVADGHASIGSRGMGERSVGADGLPSQLADGSAASSNGNRQAEASGKASVVEVSDGSDGGTKPNELVLASHQQANDPSHEAEGEGESNLVIEATAQADEPDEDEYRTRSVPESPGVPPSDAPALTLAEMQEMALQNNPTVAQASAVIDQARGVHDQVGQFPNPVVGYFGAEMGEAGTAGKQGGFIAQPIVTGDKLDLNQAVLSWDVETARWHREAQRYRVLTDVEQAFYEVLGAQRTVETALELEQVAESGVRAARELLEEGEGNRPDLLQAEVELNRVRILLDNARNRYEAAWRELASLAGRPDLAPVRLEGTLQDKPPQFEWEATYDRLLTASPEYQATLTRIEYARAQIRRQEAQPIPNLLARVGVSRDNASGAELASAEVGAFLPVFNQNEGNTLAAVAELRRAQQNAERLRLALRRELAAAFQAYRNALQQVQKYEESILPKARENLDLTEEGYRVGQFDFLTILVARRTFFETHLDYVSSLTELQQSAALIDGLLLTGGLSDVPDLQGQGPPAGIGLRQEAMSTR